MADEGPVADTLESLSLIIYSPFSTRDHQISLASGTINKLLNLLKFPYSSFVFPGLDFMVRGPDFKDLQMIGFLLDSW